MHKPGCLESIKNIFLYVQNLLNALQMDSDEMKKTLSENSRKLTVLQVNEKSLIRQYTTLVEMERQLRKENSKQKNELMSMEAEVCEKIGCLQRFKVHLAFVFDSKSFQVCKKLNINLVT